LRTSRRRVDRRITKVELVLQAMQNGCSLHLQHTKQGPCWTLSNGKPVPDSIAALVVTSASIVGVGDALYDEALSQTYRWWDAA
jgi:hypothetical protein